MIKKKATIPTQKPVDGVESDHARLLGIVAEAQRRFLSAVSIDDIYRIAAEEIHTLIIDGYTITTALDQATEALQIAAYCGFEGIEQRVIDILRVDPRKMNFPISKISESDLRIFRSAHLEYYREGIYGLMLESVPRAACSILEKFFGVHKVYTMGFLHENRHLGGLVLLPKSDIAGMTWAIEMIINHAAIVINQKMATTNSRKSDELYKSIFATMLNGMAYCKMIFEDGVPQDFIYLAVNSAFESQTGLKNVIGKPVSAVIPGIRASDPKLFEIYGRVASTGKPENFEIYVEAMKMWFAVSVFSPQPEYFAAIFDVITARKEAEDRIRHMNSVLSVLREVNALITRERNVDALLAKTCSLMIETRGFSLTWILLLDENNKYDHAAAASRSGKPDLFIEDLKNGKFPSCVTRLLRQPEPFTVCTDTGAHCFRQGDETGGTGLVSRLEHQGKVYGIIATYVPRQLAFDPEEQVLFKELAGDLGFALHSMEEEERKRQMLESLRAAEERYHSTLDNMIEGCQIIDFGWKYVYLNEAAIKHSRKTRAELLGKSIVDEYPGIEDTELFTMMRDCMYNRRPHSLKNEFIFSEGQKGTFDLRIEPVPEGVFVLSNDITGQIDAEKALRASEEQYRGLVETASEGITVTQEGMFKYVNKRMEEITGYSAKELTQMPVEWSVHPDDRAAMLDRYHQKLQGMNIEGPFTFRLIHKSGRIIWIEANAKAIEWQGKPAVLNMTNDVTARKKLEQERQDHIQQLKATVEGAISSLARIAETRDPYTAGHQQRVTKLACAIASDLGLSEDKVETVRIAGMLHDIGKVQIPAEILSKPTVLSDAEVHLIRCHPAVSYDIIKTIDMPWPVADIVIQHHERMNGSGYPAGLAGDKIILEARILAVADVVEAMASHRPYRPAMGIEPALQEITANRGILYDEKVVDCCLSLFREKQYEV